MTQKKQLLISMDPELKRLAQLKCKDQFGIPLGTFIQIFLNAFRLPGSRLKDLYGDRLFPNLKNQQNHYQYQAEFPISLI